MKRLLTFTMLATMLGAMLVSAQSVTAQEDGPRICETARNGDPVPGYEVVHGRGGSGNQIVLGTSGDDVLRGGSGNDILCGFGGNDTLRGGSGNDILVRGPGADRLIGGSGNDMLYRDGDDTRIRGGSGNDQIVVAEPEPTGATFTYTVGESDGSGCDLSYALSNAEPELDIFVDFDFANNNSVLGLRFIDETDEFGNAQGSDTTPFSLREGGSVVDARVTDADDVVIATDPAERTCG